MMKKNDALIVMDKSLHIPAKLFHGTDACFKIFDLAYKGSSTEWQNTLHGFFFTEMIGHALMFGNRILTCNLTIQKPLNIVLHKIFSIESQAGVIWEILSGEIVKPKRALKILNEEIGLGEIGDLYDTLHTDDAHEIMCRHGYDGIISNFGDGHLEYVAFGPDQIFIIDDFSRD